MGINSETDVQADLVVGPTSNGAVRIYISGPGIDIPLDFAPDEAREIASELLASAEMAEGAPAKSNKSGKSSGGDKGKKSRAGGKPRF